MNNQYQVYLWVDKKLNEHMSDNREGFEPPYRDDDGELYTHFCDDSNIILPKGTIEKLTNKKITWSDEPIVFK